MFGGHGADFLEYAPTLLAEELVAVVGVAVFGARHEAGVVADGVGKRGLQARAQNFECPSRGQVQPLHQDGGAHVTKDEVAIPVFPGQVGRRDFGVDYQHRPACTRAHGVVCHLQCEGG